MLAYRKHAGAATKRGRLERIVRPAPDVFADIAASMANLRLEGLDDTDQIHDVRRGLMGEFASLAATRRGEVARRWNVRNLSGWRARMNDVEGNACAVHAARQQRALATQTIAIRNCLRAICPTSHTRFTSTGQA